jgi:hypothetical protein
MQGAFRTPNRKDQKRTTLRYIIVRILNIQNKVKNTEICKKCQVTYEGKPIIITETLKARRTCNDVFQALKKNYCQPRLLYPAKLSFTIERKVKTFHDKQKLKKFISNKPALQKILKRILHIEEEDKHNLENTTKNKFY